MDPNEPKYYNHQFTPQMRYTGEYSVYTPTGYQQMPPQPIPGMPINASVKMENPYTNQPQVPCPTMAQQNSLTMKAKTKRRPKNETEGRIYRCSKCDRAYLSYPALYAHNKSKHSAQSEALMTHNRACTLPKKALTKKQRIDARSIHYFRTEKYKGGPTAIIYRFKEVDDILFSFVKRNN